MHTKTTDVDGQRYILKNAVRCRFVRRDKDETELPGFSLSLFADVCFETLRYEHSDLTHKIRDLLQSSDFT